MSHALLGFFNAQYGALKKLYHDPVLDDIIYINNTGNEEPTVKVLTAPKDEIKVEPKKEAKVNEKKQDKIIIDNPEVITNTSKVNKNIIEDVKVITVPENEIKVEPKKKEVKFDKEKKQDKINMEERKICPVKVIPAKTDKIGIKVGGKSTSNEDESLNRFIDQLNSLGVKFNTIERVSTGLVELTLINNAGMPLLISIDIDNRIYNIGTPIFFFGRINPIDEYTMLSFVFNKETLYFILNGLEINPKYYVPEKLRVLNRFVDVTTLKERNKGRREKVLDKAAKAIEVLNTDIVRAANGEPFRFAFARYNSENEFAIVSSSKNRVSNLSNNKLDTNKNIWINVKGKDVSLTCKN